MNQRSRAALILVVGVLGLAGVGAGVSLARTSAAREFSWRWRGGTCPYRRVPPFPSR